MGVCRGRWVGTEASGIKKGVYFPAILGSSDSIWKWSALNAPLPLSATSCPVALVLWYLFTTSSSNGGTHELNSAKMIASEMVNIDILNCVPEFSLH